MTTPITPEQEVARVRLRRWLILRLTSSLVFVVLMVLGVVLASTIRSSPAGGILVGVGVVFRVATSAFEWYVRRRVRELTYQAQGEPRWWFVRDTGEVEEGIEPRGPRRDGPYRTRDQALHAPQIAQQRATTWNAEDD